MQHTATAAPVYNRANPSPRYSELLTMYKQMHEQGSAQQQIAPQDMFPGTSLVAQVMKIREHVQRTGSRTLLDYGCGKAKVYEMTPVDVAGIGQFPSLQAFWGLDRLALYDPAYPPHSALPQGKFDMVICVDVLEHCPEQDMYWIVEGLFQYASKCVFANVACYPARKILPNGENAHCTIRPVEWWQGLIGQIAARYPAIQFEFILSVPVETPQGSQIKEISLINY